MRAGRAILALAAAVLFAATAWGQLPTSKQSNPPTSNEYRMRVLEPLEGATIRGNEFNIVIGSTPTIPPGTSVSPEERKDTLKPTFQVWVDGKDYGNIPSGSNVLAVRTAGYGPHKIVVAAKNTAGELIDRKEISVTTAAPVIAEATTTTTTEKHEARVETAPRPPPPAPAPAAPAPSYTSESSTLPATGSAYPRIALLGVGLLSAGLLLRRRS